MRKTFCDRCKNEFEYGDKLELITKAPYEVCIESRVHFGYGRKPIDICPACQKQLNELIENFMKGVD